jgi:hypothetical protein
MTTKPFNPTVHYQDRPEVSETFADSVHGLIFDGQTMRIEFCTTRMNAPQPPAEPAATQYPVCRLVLPPTAAIDLFNRMQQIMQALEKDGKITRNQMPPQTVQ